MKSGAECRVVFRLEFGGSHGLGHLARSSALATELRRRGWRCLLWSGSDPALAVPEMRGAFDDVVANDRALPAVVADANWLVIDDYGFGDEEVERLRRDVGGTSGPRLLVVDDECRRKLGAADLILNSRLGLERSPYDRRVQALLGERFALLRPGILDPDSVSAPFSDDEEGVLVIMGGTDAGGYTALALEALADLDADRFVPVVVRAKQSVGSGAVAAALGNFGRKVWLDSVGASELAGWAKACRWAISAAGGTLFELAVCRLPFVAVIVAENQRALAMEVNRRWKLPCVENGSEARRAIKVGFAALVSSEAPGSFSGVDGRGAVRVADVMRRFTPDF